MLLIPVRLKPSRIHGLGLYPACRINRGTIIWRFHPALDQVISQELWRSLEAPARDYLRRHAYVRRTDFALMLGFDLSRFMNHSDTPNTGASSETADHTVALSNLAEGDELTCNYNAFDADAPWKLGLVPASAPLGTPVS
jgi:SET domain-containing protein